MKESQKAEAGRYFRSMAQFVGLGSEEIEAVKDTRLIIEKNLPEIVAKFYDHLLKYPPTRKYFLKKDGSVDQEYLRLRMQHLTNFWRRTASGQYDDEYAGFISYVGLAHTSRGADPKIYIPERYVIGQVGFVQHAISEAISRELHEIDPETEARAQKAWNLVLMVLLEMLSRAYSDERGADPATEPVKADSTDVYRLAEETYEKGLGLYRSIEYQDHVVAQEQEIPEGERKIVQINGESIGVFHHGGDWYAVSNYCLHVGGPVATGTLDGDVLTCPWHGYQYDLTDGHLLIDPSACLKSYEVEIRESEVHLKVPKMTWDTEPRKFDNLPIGSIELKDNEFQPADLRDGDVTLVHVGGQPIAVYCVEGRFYATQNDCTDEGASLSEGELGGRAIVCPLHDSCFDVTTGEVLRGPATKPLIIYRVVIDGEIGRVEARDG